MKYKITMYDTNSARRVAYFENELNASIFRKTANSPIVFAMDDKGVLFNLDNIVQIDPIEEVYE